MSSKRANEVVEAALAKAARKSPAPGEVWWVDLDPVKGHEQGGKRPVVILSIERWNRVAERAVIVPVTRTMAPTGSERAKLEVKLASLKEPSVALPDQVTTIDWVARGATFDGEFASPEELQDIKTRLAALINLRP